MKSYPILFFAAVDDQRQRCPHAKVLPMPKTREQRAAERDGLARKFFWACMGAWSLFMIAAIGFMRGCK